MKLLLLIFFSFISISEVYSACVLFKNTEFTIRGSDCGRRCEDRKAKINCERSFYKIGCFCKSGYFRNYAWDCVRAIDCDREANKRKTTRPPLFALSKYSPNKYTLMTTPRATMKPPKKCRPNELYDECGSFCIDSCRSLARPNTCPMNRCEKGCFCTDGYFRGDDGHCVPQKDCGVPLTALITPTPAPKPMCKQNENYDVCGDHCVELCKPPDACTLADACQFGCFCKSGFYRDQNGNCVPESECPALSRPTTKKPSKPMECDDNEFYSDCGTLCGQLCLDVAKKLVCPKRKFCISGCFCKEGYYRDSKGDCVPLKDCGIEEPTTESPVDTTGVETTTIPVCNVNEEYYTCGDNCIEMCKPPNACAVKCKPGCFCSHGFYRNQKGVCIPEDECPDLPSKGLTTTPKPTKPIKCEQNEEYSDCGSRCGQSCLEQANKFTCPMRKTCVSGCFCLAGFYRDDKGDCVPIKRCVPPVEEPSSTTPTTPVPTTTRPDCKESEHFDSCGDHCIELCKPPESCESSCVSGCFCDKGYYRFEERGKCIPENECPQDFDPTTTPKPLKCDENEEYSDCGTRCGQMCADIGKQIICPKKGLCVSGCFCVPGFYRTDEGICVPYIDCPDNRPPLEKPLTCDENEEYNKCGNRCGQSCEEIGRNKVCPKSNKCTAGCFCIEGYFKDEFGNCVPFIDCPDNTPTTPKPMICDQNEEYSDCGSRCGQTCIESQKVKVCPKKRSCVEGCFCIQGYVRNEDGECIPEKDCPKPKNPEKPINCDENEEYSNCGTRCAQGCDDLGRKIMCPKGKQCVSGCFCKEGYYRDENGDCVPESQCPDFGPPDRPILPPECADNEEYSDCGTRCGQGCDELGQRVICPRRRMCISGCFCKEGYFRDESGNCVPILDCPNISPPKAPPPLCDANENYTECGHRCGQACAGQIRGKVCPDRQPCVTGCFCINDYMRDEDGNCIPKTKCSPLKPPKNPIKCDPNEEYSDCGTRCGQGCEDLGNPVFCPRRRMCVSGCFCKNGYYRNEEGECVPESECPPTAPPKMPPKCGKNEKYSDCGTNCGQSCEAVGKTVMCPRRRLCISGCFCKKGFYRDNDDDCVPRKQCPNEGPNGPQKPKPTKAPKITPTITPAIDEPIESETPPEDTTTPEDSTISEVTTAPEETTTSEETTPPEEVTTPEDTLPPEEPVESDTPEPTEPTKKPKTKLTTTPKPITTTTTPKCPRTAEHEKKCGSRCKESCKSVTGKKEGRQTCLKQECEKGCFCNEGLYRDKYGQCVPEDQCDCDLPPQKCPGPNEEYTACGYGCGVTCAQVNKGLVRCPETCGRGCFCTKGNFRNNEGICVPVEECDQFMNPKPGISGDDEDPSDHHIEFLPLGRSIFFNCTYGEKFSKCGHHCGETCQDLIAPVKCPKKCEVGCFCKKGLYRDADGMCGPKHKCDLPTTEATAPPSCPQNEVYNECGNSCAESCEDRNDCQTGCERGCFCLSGYLRNKYNQCVPEDQCKEKEQCKACKINEYYANCGSDCGQTCNDLRKSADCAEVCEEGCWCKLGFFRSGSGHCVPRSQCS